MTTSKILAFAGSARTQSFNKTLVKIAATGATATGAEVTYVDFKELPLPLFDEDLEAAEGVPENAVKLKNMMKASHGFLIACPEYNSSITPLLKNAIDWVSRPVPNETGPSPFQDKVAVLMSTSPGGLGGIRGLVHVRAILSSIGILVLPDQKAIPHAHEAFNQDGTLKDIKQQTDIENLGRKLATVLTKLV